MKRMLRLQLAREGRKEHVSAVSRSESLRPGPPAPLNNEWKEERAQELITESSGQPIIIKLPLPKTSTV